MNVPIPKLAIIGVIVLLIGFSPEILATIKVDAVDPNIVWIYPGGTIDKPHDFKLGEGFNLAVILNTIDTTAVVCNYSCANVSGISPLNLVSRSAPGEPRLDEWQAPFTMDYDEDYTFVFTAYDEAGRTDSMTGYATVGDAHGDFYLKDGNDAGWTMMNKESTATFDHSDIYFKFVGTDKWEFITKVWVEVSGYPSWDLNQITDREWDESMITLPDGTYEVEGYFKAFNTTVRGMHILGGIGEPITPPSEWSMYDWLKILGGALIVVGFIVKK